MSQPINDSEASEGQEITPPVAKTAGEQDHSDPWKFAGEDADAPTDQAE